MNKNKLHIIGVAMGWGARESGCEDGPAILKQSTLMDELYRQGNDVMWPPILTTSASAQHLADPTKPADIAKEHILEMHEKISTRIKQSAKVGAKPVVIGGDHSVAMSTWSTVIASQELEQNFGLLWVDAHLDAHTPETAHEGKWGGHYHGQALAALLGYGDPDFVGLESNKVKLNPQHVCIIGARSFEPSERKLLDELGVRIYDIEEVNRRSINTVMHEAKSIFIEKTKAFGVSIDMDAFNPMQCPGVGTPEPDGISIEKFTQTLTTLGHDTRLKGIEIVEYNPHKDEGHKTRSAIEEILKYILK